MKSALLFLLMSAVPVAAAGTSCPQFFVGGTAPDILKETLVQRTVEVCYSDFGVMHSGVTAGPLWSAQSLTGEAVRAAKAVARVDDFFAEPSVPAADRADLSDYSRSGYDRGHLAPSADMSTVRAQAESFTLANMVPQTPALNRKLWANIESTTRGLALSYGQVYVVTGPAFVGSSLKRIGGRVLVPTSTFKAVYVPSMGAAGVWWADNAAAGDRYEVISVEELRRRISVDVFPSVPENVKSIAAVLPAPKAGSDSVAGARPSQEPAARGTRSQPKAESQGWADVLWAVGEDVIRRWMR